MPPAIRVATAPSRSPQRGLSDNAAGLVSAYDDFHLLQRGRCLIKGRHARSIQSTGRSHEVVRPRAPYGLTRAIPLRRCPDNGALAVHTRLQWPQ